MEFTANHITLLGELNTLPAFSHENHGKRFYRFLLDVPRLSGAVDTLPIIAEESRICDLDPCAGSRVQVTGQIRTHNRRWDNARHLLIFVFAQEVSVDDGEPVNDVILEGLICRDPVYRHTPLGREICDLMLAVPRAFHRADYIPCILWGRNALEVSGCHTRDRIRIEGRFQSRSYTKLTEAGAEERTAYEISAMSVEILEYHL